MLEKALTGRRRLTSASSLSNERGLPRPGSKTLEYFVENLRAKNNNQLTYDLKGRGRLEAKDILRFNGLLVVQPVV